MAHSHLTWLICRPRMTLLSKRCDLQAWEHAPLETLQLVAHLRDVREGKGERRCGWDAYIWLAHHHPRTLLVNLPEVAKVLHTAHTLIAFIQYKIRSDYVSSSHTRLARCLILEGWIHRVQAIILYNKWFRQ